MNIKLLILVSLITVSCNHQNTTNEERSTSVMEVESEKISDDDKDEYYMINDDSFQGISVGDKIETISKSQIEKSEIETGEGVFSVYGIKSKEGNEIGYFHPEPLDESLVGMIVVTSNKAKTTDGFGIGTTYEEVKSKLNDFEVHGSEIESRTHVYYKNLSMKLDFASTEYNLDKENISGATKIVEITIHRILDRVNND